MDPEYPTQLSRAPNPNTQLVEFTPQLLPTTPKYWIDWRKKILQTFCKGQGHFVTSHLGDNMASVTWATKVSTKWVDQIDQLTDIFKEGIIFVVWLGRFAPLAK